MQSVAEQDQNAKIIKKSNTWQNDYVEIPSLKVETLTL